MSWVDVVAIWREAIAEMKRDMPTPTGGTNEHPVRFFARLQDMETAADAIAELIAAVDERRAACDEATRLTEWMYTLQPAPSDFTREARQAAIERFNAAIVRETAALAACKPARGAEEKA